MQKYKDWLERNGEKLAELKEEDRMKLIFLEASSLGYGEGYSRGKTEGIEYVSKGAQDVYNQGFVDGFHKGKAEGIMQCKDKISVGKVED